MLGPHHSDRWYEPPACGELMTVRTFVGGMVSVVALLTVATPAQAGAPNYECRAGSYRIGIDQHRRAGLTRVNGGDVRKTSFANTDQNGSTLNLIATVDSQRLSVAIRGTGSTMSLGVGRHTISGSCAFVPGNFVLGYVTAPALVLRTSPSDMSPEVGRYVRSSLVWSSGRFDEQTGQMVGTADWARFRMIVRVRGGTAHGGDQQLGMGTSAGLDGAATIVEGWARLTDVSMLGPPGP